MGGKQSKRSVDITTTPKKEGLPEGVISASGGDMKVEKIEEADAKPTTNGVGPHADSIEDKDKDKDEANEKDKDKEETKSEETKPDSTAETPATPGEGGEVTTPTETTPAAPNTANTPDSKETKKKEKPRKKWSFRSISFGRKDKSKPSREDTPKNGDVSKEEPLAEGGEEAEAAAEATNGSTTTTASPAEEKSGAASPTETDKTATAETVAEAKEEKVTTESKPSSPVVVEEKKEEPTTPVPVVAEDKKEEVVEKIMEAEKKTVEVSPTDCQSNLSVKISVGNISSNPIPDPDPIEPEPDTAMSQSPTVIERKTIEDLQSQFPSSPPPTPIDPSPLQTAQQTAANASAIAEALKFSPSADESPLKSHESPNLEKQVESKDILSSPCEKESKDNIKVEEKEVADGEIIVEEEVIEVKDPIPDIDVDENLTQRVIEPDYPSCADEREVSEEILVEAKPAYVIPDDEIVEDDVIENTNLKAENTDVVEVCEVEEKLDTETSLKSAEGEEEAAAEVLCLDEPDDEELPDPVDSVISEEPVTEAIIIVEKLDEGKKEIMEIVEIDEESGVSSSLPDPPENENDVLSSASSISGQSLVDSNTTNLDKTCSKRSKSHKKNPSKNSTESNLEYPLPPEDLSSSCSPSHISNDVESNSQSGTPRNPTDTLLTPPGSPQNTTNQSNLGIANTKDSSQIIQDDDQSNREVNVESVSNNQISHSFNDTSDVELNERLAELNLADEETLLCQMSKNDCKITAIVQENHQTIIATPVSEVKIENNVTEIITENGDDAPKIAPPAIPSEPPISPPSAPAITEDVASVTKAIEEIEISDKAVAAAVNEAIECVNSNEIITDVHHQNNLNE